MIESIYEWDFSWISVLAGAIGGFVNAVVSSDAFVLPSVSGRKIFWASLKSVIVGAFVGFVVNTHPVFSALMGYSGTDVLHMVERKIRKRLGVGEAETDTYA
jgi:hypothetical protein